jgi:hypothetical protein
MEPWLLVEVAAGFLEVVGCLAMAASSPLSLFAFHTYKAPGLRPW